MTKGLSTGDCFLIFFLWCATIGFVGAMGEDVIAAVNACHTESAETEEGQ